MTTGFTTTWGVCPRCHAIIDIAASHICTPLAVPATAADRYTRLRAGGLPRLVTAEDYHAALLLWEALAVEIEAFEASLELWQHNPKRRNI